MIIRDDSTRLWTKCIFKSVVRAYDCHPKTFLHNVYTPTISFFFFFGIWRSSENGQANTKPPPCYIWLLFILYLLLTSRFINMLFSPQNEFYTRIERSKDYQIWNKEHIHVYTLCTVSKKLVHSLPPGRAKNGSLSIASHLDPISGLHQPWVVNL